MVKVAIIGCGRIAERHLDAYRKLDDVEVIVSDQDLAAAQQLADSMHVAWSPSPTQLLEASDVDAVDVCVPTVAHAQLVLTALAADKHVFCEKPLCLTLAEGQAIARAQQAAGKLVMVGYLYRFHPAFEFAKQVLDDGVIGRPHFGLFRLGGRGSHRSWKHTASAGGGATLEVMVHSLDLVNWLLGPVDDVQVLARETLLDERTIAGQRHAVDAEDYVVARLRAGGTEVLCQSDMLTPSYMNYVEVHGSNGTLFTSILHYLPTVVYCRETRGIFNIGNNIQHFSPVNLFDLEIGYFVRALRQDIAPRNGIDDSLAVLSVVDQIRAGSVAVGVEA